MKWMLATLLAALLAIPAAAAQMTENGFTGDSHLRAAYGDVPLSAAVEPDGRWNAVEYHRVHHVGGRVTEAFSLVPGASVDGATCTCGNVTVTAAGTYLARSDAEAPAGDYVVALSYHLAVAGPNEPTALVFQPLTGNLWGVDLYLRQGQTVFSRAAETMEPLPGATHPEYTIHEFTGSGGAGLTTFFELNGPASTSVAPAAAPNVWLYAAAGLVVGCILWAVLVSRGMVQRKTRKQTATTAAHVEAAKAEPVTVLEGRKRVLMAALKEVELARQADEMDVPTYDTLKAELKKETVTVMRAIDEAKQGEKA